MSHHTSLDLSRCPRALVATFHITRKAGFLGLLVWGDRRERAERERDVFSRRRGGDDSNHAARERELVA